MESTREILKVADLRETQRRLATITNGADKVLGETPKMSEP